MTLKIAVAYWMKRRKVQRCMYSRDKEIRRTSLPLFELPAKAFRKLARGSWMWVLPERTTQPGGRYESKGVAK